MDYFFVRLVLVNSQNFVFSPKYYSEKKNDIAMMKQKNNLTPTSEEEEEFFSLLPSDHKNV